jgi:hypothetical protein
MRPCRAGAVLVLVAQLAACGVDAPPAPPPPPEADRALERAVQAPLDKARGVEEELRKARAAQDAKLREEGG